MKRKVLIASFLFTGILVGMMVSPSLAATTWGVEINERYEFTLKTFKFGSPTDISFMLKENVTFGVEFTSFNDTGYTYDIYNSSGLMESGISTLFEEMETELGNITMPLGLPIVMPLAIGTSSNYLLEVGTIVNQTSILIGSEDFVNLTEFGNDTVVNVKDVSGIRVAVLLTSDHLNVKEYQDLSKFEDLMRKVKFYCPAGDCYGYYLLASGFAQIMVDPIMSFWDTMALIPIIKGAGGIITDYQGNDPVKGDSIIATTPNIHKDVIKILN